MCGAAPDQQQGSALSMCVVRPSSRSCAYQHVCGAFAYRTSLGQGVPPPACLPFSWPPRLAEPPWRSPVRAPWQAHARRRGDRAARRSSREKEAPAAEHAAGPAAAPRRSSRMGSWAGALGRARLGGFGPAARTAARSARMPHRRGASPASIISVFSTISGRYVRDCLCGVQFKTAASLSLYQSKQPELGLKKRS